jgi:hypothetical protein
VRVVVLAICLWSASALADDRDLAYVEVGAVGGLPRSNIRSVDPGIGTQLHVGFAVHRAPPLLVSLFIGYRRMWTSERMTFGTMSEELRVWTDELMLGARVERELATRWRAFGQLHFAKVNLDSRWPDGLIDYTYHHRGWGAGLRVGGSYEIVEHLRAMIAVGYSHAETKYDDHMGVAWLTLDATLTAHL